MGPAPSPLPPSPPCYTCHTSKLLQAFHHQPARFLAEMEGWLADDERPEGVWKCGKCNRVGMVGLTCNKRDCNTKFHSYCVAGLQKCPRCKTPLTGTGEAIKRSR